MEQEFLHLDYELSLKDYREFWFDSYKKSLPNLLIFWGTPVVLSLLGLLFSSEKLIFALTAITFSSIPIYIALMSYQNYLNVAKKAFNQLPDSQRNTHLTFHTNSDGFDCMRGKNFSHIAWETIKGVHEKDDCFVFEMAGNSFLIPKIAFRHDSEIKFLRMLISTNIGTNAKLRQ